MPKYEHGPPDRPLRVCRGCLCVESTLQVNIMTTVLGWCLIAYVAWRIKQYLNSHPDQAARLRTSVRSLFGK